MQASSRAMLTAIVVSLAALPMAAQAPDTIVRLDEAWVQPGVSGGTTAVYLSFTNLGGTALPIVGLSSADADSVAVVEGEHRARTTGPIGFLVRPHHALAMTWEGLHLELRGLHRDLHSGDQLTLRLTGPDGVRLNLVAVVRDNPPLSNTARRT